MTEYIDDFDKMVALNATDPEEFQQRYQQLIDEFLDGVPDEEQRDRLRACQSNLMQKLSLEKDDTQRYNKMVEIFWEQFHEFNDAHEPFRSGTHKKPKLKESADIIDFPQNKDL